MHLTVTPCESPYLRHTMENWLIPRRKRECSQKVATALHRMDMSVNKARHLHKGLERRFRWFSVDCFNEWPFSGAVFTDSHKLYLIQVPTSFIHEEDTICALLLLYIIFIVLKHFGVKGQVSYAYHPSTWEAEAQGRMQAKG